MALTGLLFTIEPIYIDIYLLAINEPVKNQRSKIHKTHDTIRHYSYHNFRHLHGNLKFTTVTEIMDKTIKKGTKLLNEITKTIKIKEIKD